MTHETLTSSQLSVKTAALRMLDLPLSVYGSLAQVRVSWKVTAAPVSLVRICVVAGGMFECSTELQVIDSFFYLQRLKSKQDEMPHLAKLSRTNFGGREHAEVVSSKLESCYTWM